MQDEDTAQAATSANDEVAAAMDSTTNTPSRKRKREEYGTYSPEVRLKMARYCIDNGPAKTARFFTKELGRTVNESTVRNMKKAYLGSPKRELFKTAMPRSPRGRPSKLGEVLENNVKDYIRGLRVSGCAVNTRIIMAAARGIILHKDKKLLCEFGGQIELTKPWAASLMQRMGLSKRKATKGVKQLQSDFEDVKTQYLDRISKIVTDDKIPPELIINWDQTGVNLVPCGNWTMEETGSKQVPIKGYDDKRQITALLGITRSGVVLPPQVLYQGKTDMSNPNYKYPDDWDIYHSESHWSTSETMKRYVENIIIPYVDNYKFEHDLSVVQKALCIFDVYKAHRGEELLELLGKNSIRVVYVPASCTDQLQPLDLIPNNVFKSLLKSEFQDYYASEIQSQLEAGTDIRDVKVDLRLSVIKPLHAKWLHNAVEKLSKQTGLIKKSFSLAGIE